jgi:hypothetical protein
MEKKSPCLERNIAKNANDKDPERYLEIEFSSRMKAMRCHRKRLQDKIILKVYSIRHNYANPTSPLF